MGAIENTNNRSEARNAARGGRRLSIIEGEQTCVRWWGRELMEVENHGGVLEFTNECIRLYSKLGILRIEGKKLDIRLADSESVIVDGSIDSISYENSRKKG